MLGVCYQQFFAFFYVFPIKFHSFFTVGVGIQIQQDIIDGEAVFIQHLQEFFF